MYVFDSGRGGRFVGGEWVTGLGLGFTNSGETWEKWDMCLCFGCGGVGGVGGELVGSLGQGLWGWGGVMSVCVVRWIICVDGRSRYMHIVLGAFLRILCAPSVFTTIMYRTLLISINLPLFYEEHCPPTRGFA